MPPIVRAALIAVALTCAAPTAQSSAAMVARVTPGASLAAVAATVGTARAPDSPAFAAASAPDAATLPARLILSALSLGGLAMYLRRYAHRLA